MDSMDIDVEEQKIFIQEYFERQTVFTNQLSHLSNFLITLPSCPELNSLLQQFVTNLKESLKNQYFLLQQEENFLYKQDELLQNQKQYQEQLPSPFQCQMVELQQFNQLGVLSQLLQQYVNRCQDELQYHPLFNRHKLLQQQLTLLETFQKFIAEYQNILTSGYKHIEQHQIVVHALVQSQTFMQEYQQYLSEHQQFLQNKENEALKSVQEHIQKICLDFGDRFIISKEVYDKIIMYQNSEFLIKLTPMIDNTNYNDFEQSNELVNKNDELKRKYDELQMNFHEKESQNNETVRNYLEQIQDLNNNYDSLQERWNKLNGNYLELERKNKELESEKQESNKSIWRCIVNKLKSNKDQNFELPKHQNLDNGNKKIEINQNLEQDYRILEDNYQTLKTNHQNLEAKYQSLQTNNQDLKSNYQNLEAEYQSLQTNNQDLKLNYQNLEAIYQSLKIDHDSMHKNQEKSVMTNLKLIDDLTKTNNNLKKEVTKYQSALGDATSFHLGYQDSDNAGQLSKDILVLHNNLDKFCGLKKVAEINESEVNELLNKYSCSIPGSINKNKNLISGLLERYIIETIIKKSKEYFKFQEYDKDIEQGDPNLEMKVINTTEQLLRFTKSISEYRSGTDVVSKAITTKLRQQIYGVLGNRGFSNIGDKEHPLIVKLRSEITDLMNRYRTITNQEKLLENDALINTIIRQVINIFLFRLKVQEPIADWKFFESKTNINTIMMEASWDCDSLEEIYVGVCAFPVIGSNLCEANEEDINMKIINPQHGDYQKGMEDSKHSEREVPNNMDGRFQNIEIRNETIETSNTNYGYEIAGTRGNEYHEYGMPIKEVERYTTTRIEDDKQFELNRQITRNEKYKTSWTSDNKYQERDAQIQNTGERYQATEFNDGKHSEREKLSNVTYYKTRMEDAKQLEPRYQTTVIGNNRHKEKEIQNNSDMSYSTALINGNKQPEYKQQTMR
ncbi:3604_t:CDS:2 [Gigaspora margarita]|uniref:3604_t:CDS:1 n=1 Tax=Gigaspora margarita TaxID=4874 RepID=A0ABM8VXY9_GIGMA|nr:3604_t:CDS:2 [Gigaspora margarita]